MTHALEEHDMAAAVEVLLLERARLQCLADAQHAWDEEARMLSEAQQAEAACDVLAHEAAELQKAREAAEERLVAVEASRSQRAVIKQWPMKRLALPGVAGLAATR